LLFAASSPLPPLRAFLRSFSAFFSSAALLIFRNVEERTPVVDAAVDRVGRSGLVDCDNEMTDLKAKTKLKRIVRLTGKTVCLLCYQNLSQS
jgi:hypothetical protein